MDIDTNTGPGSSDQTGSTRPTISIDIYSDVVCPWCYIGKRRFEAGLAEATEDGDLGVDFDIEYKPYQLDPTAAPGVAGPVLDAYAKKFGGPEKAEQIIGHVTRTAAEDGLEFRMDRAQRANTLLAHRLIWWAGQPESPVTQDAMKERLLRAYFMDGTHVGDAGALADCAADVGVDRDEAIAFLESSEGTAEVAAELDHARDTGITAVPTYVFNDQWAVPGAQDSATFAKVLRKMADQALADAPA
ncbi:DsbA family oxidoreductase [Ilumatobacter nonamiensis]|uniref:DsbA family oxidoreductase n=1 Tax=Ilumatobacter nonamiensis TaxID=467093 RepID=UPI000349933D|nr:DsbA family oxidoreductase [Ilumatobacter nonamiensis]